MSNDILAAKAAEIIGKLEASAPKAADIVLASARADAMVAISWGIFGAINLIILYWFITRRFVPWANGTKDNWGDWNVGPIVCAFLLGLYTLVCIVLVLAGLNPWNFITLQHPELWVAHQVLSSIK